MNDNEIIVDLFAGGGGASTGIELATGQIVNIAINHDKDAILMHKTNHPGTTHYQTDVWDVDPEQVCQGKPVGLLWASPDCKHFSKAKGAALVDRHIRGLAWIVLRWAGTVKPRVILLENVEEFQTWGPVRKGKPVKKKSGETFKKWLSQLRALGYQVDYKELVAADYGAPTIRKRFVLVARCDGKPIVWPKRTHAPAESEDVRSGQCLPWRSAADVIDWNLPAYSVFATKQEIKEKYGATAVRPLAENTMRRVIRGVDRFTIRSGRPFLVGNTVPVTFSNTNGSVGFSADRPIHTVTSDGKQILSCAQIIQYHTEQSEKVRGQGVDDPLQTIDSSNRYGLVTAHLTEYYGNGNPIDPTEPMRTITAHDREALTAVHIVKFKGDNLGQSPEEPLQTITTSAGEFAACRTVLSKVEKGANLGYWPQIRTLLNRHCGYTIGEDEVLLLEINGVYYYIRDILLRMLSPRELYNAMGFPSDYIIDHDYKGNTYGKTKQVARCGNAVCPPMAEAVVRANFKSGPAVKTMEEWRNAISA